MNVNLRTRWKRAAAVVLLAAAMLGPLWGCAQEPPGRFVVLVVMDTVRRDALGCYGGPATPAVDALAADGVRFERAIATSGWTLPSVASILTATWPSLHGALGRGTTLSAIRPEVATVAEVLQGKGFRTAAYANAAFVSPKLGIGRGFDVFDHVYVFNEDSRRADETVAAAIAWAREHRSDDCFILVHLFDAHLDYDPPPGFAARYTGGRGEPVPPLSMEDCLDLAPGPDAAPDSADIAYVRAVYQGEVAFADEQIGRLVETLRSIGVYDRSFVVVTSDHGEEFWEHGGFEHGHTLYDELVRVPLVIKFPSDLHPTTRVVRWQVPLIDVMPTVLDYLAVAAPASFAGKSLMPYVRGEPAGHRDAFSESLLYGERSIAWRGSRYTYVQNIETGKDSLGETYDWRTDAGESNNLTAGDRATAEQLRAEAMAFYLDLLERSASMSVLETIDMSPEEIEKLRSLGYVR